MPVFTIFPLLTLSLVIFAILNAMSAGDAQAWYDSSLAAIPLVSGGTWNISFGDAFLMGSLVLLFIEILRSTQTGNDTLINHGLSFLLFLICFALFIIVESFGNSLFFILMLMTVLDLLAGAVVTTVSSRRDLAVAGPGVSAG